MRGLELVALIVFICVAAGVINNWLKHRGKRPQQPDDLEERLRKLSELEERVEVLEKIVTDRKFDLEQQFRDLERS